MLKALRLRFLPSVVSLVGCQALPPGKPRSLVLLALEGGSGALQVPEAWSPSCAAGSLSPSHTADELTPPTGAQRHCNAQNKKSFTVSRTLHGGGWWWVWSVIWNQMFLRQDILSDCVIAGGTDNAVHGKSCRQEVGFLDCSAEDRGRQRAGLCHLHHQAKVNDTLNDTCEFTLKHMHTQTA